MGEQLMIIYKIMVIMAIIYSSYIVKNHLNCWENPWVHAGFLWMCPLHSIAFHCRRVVISSPAENIPILWSQSYMCLNPLHLPWFLLEGAQINGEGIVFRGSCHVFWCSVVVLRRSINGEVTQIHGCSKTRTVQFGVILGSILGHRHIQCGLNGGWSWIELVP